MVAFLMKNLGRKKEGGYKWKMNLSTITKNYEEILKAIELEEPFQGPVLSVNGALSDYVAYEDELALFQLFPNIEFERVEHAGHWVHADRPEEFYGTVLRFLKKH